MGQSLCQIARAIVSHLSVKEAVRIAALISSDLRDYVGRYDTRKYPPEVYDRIRRAFSVPKGVTRADIETAILWKYGHLGKSGYPKHHVGLIQDVQKLWPAFLRSGSMRPDAMREFWANELGRPKAFITIAFLVHLLHQHDLPIIDQHNYRAVNYYMTKVRRSWVSRRMPRHMDDLRLVAEFIKSVQSAWPSGAHHPSARDLDKYLMMFGKALKARRRMR